MSDTQSVEELAGLVIDTIELQNLQRVAAAISALSKVSLPADNKALGDALRLYAIAKATGDEELIPEARLCALGAIVDVHASQGSDGAIFAAVDQRIDEALSQQQTQR